MFMFRLGFQIVSLPGGGSGPKGGERFKAQNSSFDRGFASFENSLPDAVGHNGIDGNG